MLRDHCSLYNGALQERRDAYRHVSKTSVRYGMQSGAAQGHPGVRPGASGPLVVLSSQQATLRRLDKAFAAFFRRVKSGETPGYPRFRGVNWFDTVDFPKDGDGCRWDSTPHDPVTRVRLQGVGHVKVNQHRPVAGRVKTVSVKREGRRWFVVLTAETGASPSRCPRPGSVVGIDLGIANFLADSDGEFVPNPRHGRTRRREARSRAAGPVPVPAPQGQGPHRQPPAGRGQGRRSCTARYGASASTTRTRPPSAWSAHTTVIAHEDLRIRNMSRAPAPKPDPDRPGAFLPNGAAAKAGLNQVDQRCRLGGVPDDPARQG